MSLSDEIRALDDDQEHPGDRVMLYPHAGGREWSTIMHDEWKRDLGVAYVRGDALTPEEAAWLVERVERGRQHEIYTKLRRIADQGEQAQGG